MPVFVEPNNNEFLADGEDATYIGSSVSWFATCRKPAINLRASIEHARSIAIEFACGRITCDKDDA